MKRTLGMLAAAMTALAFSGCASVQQAQKESVDDVDTMYVAAVERAARQFGTQVYWINMPKKRAQ